MLCLSGLELYSRWVPLITRIVAPMGLISDQEADRAKFTFADKETLRNILIGMLHFQAR